MSIEAVRQNEPQFRALIEYSTEAIALVTDDGVIAYTSPSTERITGYTAEELLGQPGLSLVHPDDWGQLQSALASIRAQVGAFTTITCRLLLGDGTFIWVEATISNRLTDPAIDAFVVNYRDISAYKRQAETLHAVEERYRAVVQTSRDGIWVMDTQACTLYASQMMAELLGVAAESMTTRSLLEFVSPDDEARSRTHIDRCLQGHSEQFESGFRHTDGNERSVSVSITPIYEAADQLTGIFGMFTDLTTRKRLQQETRIRARDFETLFEAMTDGVFVYDAIGSLIQTNSVARRMLSRFVSREALSLPLSSRADSLFPRLPNGKPFPKDDIPLLRILRGEVLTGANTADVVVRTFAGEDLCLNLSGTPLHDEQGRITGAMAIARDVTERRKLERRTKRVLDALLEMAQVLVQASAQDSPSEVSATDRLRPVMQRVGELTRTVLGCQRLSFMGIEAETEVIYPLAVTGLPPAQEASWWEEHRQQHTTLSSGPDPSLLPRMRARELLLLDLTQPLYRDWPNPYGIRQMLMAPMVSGSRLLGFLSLDYGGLNHTYTPEELALTRAVTELATLVMEREHLLIERTKAQADAFSWQTAHQRMVELIELAHDAIIVRDPANRIVFWNRGAERLYGWQNAEALGQVTHSLLLTRFPSSELLSSPAMLDKHLAALERWEGILQHTNRAGERLVVESRQVLVRNQAGEPEAILEINRDATERERILQEREEARANELAAREATRRMDEFIGIASHELKTPLTSIKGNLQLARRRVTSTINGGFDDQQRIVNALAGIQLMLDRAERQVDVQNRLVSDLVNDARIQNNKLELHLVRADLVAIVRECVEDQRLSTPARVISFTATLPAVSVLADGERICQVVSNYLSNALKYSPKEQAVAVRLALADDQALVEVTDMGPGLLPFHQKRIWERFYRVPDVEVQSGTSVGLGLGLHICRMIIEQHQGVVGVQSTPGEGATFWFTLPLLKEEENGAGR